MPAGHHWPPTGADILSSIADCRSLTRLAPPAWPPASQMHTDLQILFVYGSLRPALARGEPRRLIADLEHLGTASVPGELYDLGDYPGMVAGSGRVWGDLLRAADPARLAQLDEYEECGGSPPLFRRVRLTASRSDGSCCQAWAYRYARSVAGRRHLPAGDYVAYRTSRQS